MFYSSIKHWLNYSDITPKGNQKIVNYHIVTICNYVDCLALYNQHFKVRFLMFSWHTTRNIT